jgi:hypothetical protein
MFDMFAQSTYHFPERVGVFYVPAINGRCTIRALSEVAGMELPRF